MMVFSRDAHNKGKVEKEESGTDTERKHARLRLFTVNAACGEKSPLTLLKADLKTLPDCRADSITFLLIFSLSLSPSLPEFTALSKSPPDFQLLSLVVVPDKQNLLDQADFTAAPAHMAASVAHFLS